MAAQEKKKKKGIKGTKMALTDFLSDEQGNVQGPGTSYVLGGKSMDWAAEMENAGIEDFGDIEYGRPAIDRTKLPTAPKAARGPDVDTSSIPENGPFVAYIGNLPYEATEQVIGEFFQKLKVASVRLPEENGRLRGFGYVEFLDKQSLLDALLMNEETIIGRKVRVDLAGQNQQSDRGHRDRDRDDGPDRTDTDWRRAAVQEPAPQNDSWGRGGDRGGYNDRGGYGSRGGYGDRGSSRYDDRGPSRGFDDRGPSRGYDDRGPSRGYDDRGPSRDHYNDRSWGSRGSNEDRGRYDDQGSRGGYDDRGPRGGYDDRGPRGGYDDRGPRGGYDDRGPRGYENRGPRGGYDDRGPRSGGYNDRGPRGGFDDQGPRDGGRRGYGSGYQRDDGLPRSTSQEGPKERPKLNLQPRSKPKEAGDGTSERSSSIFGNAKPVNTAAREREIEERLQRQQEEERRKKFEEEKENRNYPNTRDREGYHPRSAARRDSDNSSEGRTRRLSSGSKGRSGPPPVNSPSRSRRESENSNHSSAEVFSGGEENKEEPKTPVSPQKEEPVKLVPAPPPAVNVWQQRKTEGKAASAPQPSSPPVNKDTPNSDSKSVTNVQKSPPDSWRGKPASAKSTEAPPPTGNVWAKRAKEREQMAGSRKPGVHGDANEDRGQGQGRGRGGFGSRPKPQKEKHTPQSIEDMPKLETKPEKVWSDKNKFAELLDDENEQTNED